MSLILGISRQTKECGDTHELINLPQQRQWDCACGTMNARADGQKNNYLFVLHMRTTRSDEVNDLL